jgi:hypothetical protein
MTRNLVVSILQFIKDKMDETWSSRDRNTNCIRNFAVIVYVEETTSRAKS